MRARHRRLVLLVAASSAVTLLDAGCRAPTQVTLDVRTTAPCHELSGVTLTVGSEPASLEPPGSADPLFVSAMEPRCTTATPPEKNAIGTLVVTPGGEGRAAVVVVAGYGGKDPATCRPPEYEGCIVARRRFAFEAHASFVLPITLSPDCLDVPCDAFTTCRTGRCFDAEVVLASDGSDGSAPPEPGELPDGGTGVPDGGAVGSPSDAALASDGAPPDGVAPHADAGTPVSCAHGALVCGAQTCIQGYACCHIGDAAQCRQTTTCPGIRYCCTNADCGPFGACLLLASHGPDYYGHCSGAGGGGGGGGGSPPDGGASVVDAAVMP